MRRWPEIVGGNVKRLRKAHGLTQEVVAQRAEIVVRYLSGIEGGKENPTVEVLGRLAEALGVHPSVLWAEGE